MRHEFFRHAKEANIHVNPKRKPHQDDRGRAERARRQHQEDALDDALKNTFDPVSIEQPAHRRLRRGPEASTRRCRRMNPPTFKARAMRDFRPGARSFFFVVALSTDTWTAREFPHTVGDNSSQLHHLLAQFSVFRNVALNAIAISLQFSPQRLKLTDEIIDFAHRSF